MLIFLSFALGIYSYRRWREIRRLSIEVQNTIHELRSTKLLQEKVFDSLSDGVFFLDAKTRNIILCNEGARKIFGRLAFQALEAQGFLETEFQLRRKDGQVFHAEHRVTAIHNDNGIRTDVVSVVRDIDARQKMPWTDLREIACFVRIDFFSTQSVSR